MSNDQKPAVGSIGWIDLTVPNADEVRDFYKGVVGFPTSDVSMGDYNDYCLLVNDQPVAGVCHARGSNADIPPAWLIYITVADLDESLAKVTGLGGEIVLPARGLAGGRFAVVKDPGGAVSGLYEAPA